MNTVATQRCSFDECKKPVIWARTERGKRIPLDADPVDPGRKGALVLIGGVAFGRVSAVRRLVAMFGVDESAADLMAHEEYGWHLAHMWACVPWQQRRRGR